MKSAPRRTAQTGLRVGVDFVVVVGTVAVGRVLLFGGAPLSILLFLSRASTNTRFLFRAAQCRPRYHTDQKPTLAFQEQELIASTKNEVSVGLDEQTLPLPSPPPEREKSASRARERGGRFKCCHRFTRMQHLFMSRAIGSSSASSSVAGLVCLWSVVTDTVASN